MFFDVTRYDSFPVSADFRLYLRDRIKKSRRFAEYRERSGCPTFARMSRDDLIGAVRGCGLDFIALYHQYHRNPPSAVTKKFRGQVAIVQLDAAREKLTALGYTWHEQSGKWLEKPKW